MIMREAYGWRPERKMRRAQMHFLTGPGSVAKIHIRKKQSFLLCMRDAKPEAMSPADGPGLYEVDAMMLKPDARWPLVVMVVPEKDVPLLQNMDQAVVNEMIDTAQTIAFTQGAA